MTLVDLLDWERGFVRKRSLVSQIAWTCVSILAFLAATGLAAAQTANAPWTGQVTCNLNLQSQGYTRQETQTWTIAGPMLRMNGAMQIYPVTWTVSGSGSAQRLQNGLTSTVQWNTSVPPANLTFAVFVRASDQRLIFRQWGSQAKTDYAIRGMRQAVWNGAQQQPAAFSHPVWEWHLGPMEADATDSNPSGSFTTAAEAMPAELAGPPSVPMLANCTWHFSSTGNAAPPQTGAPASYAGSGQSTQNPSVPANSCVQSSGNITQAFLTMKAEVARDFDTLIQGTTDPATAQSLQAQKQQTLAALDAQEQQDLQGASQGCNGGTQTASTQAPGSNQGYGTGTATGGNPGGSQTSTGSQNNGQTSQGSTSTQTGQNTATTQNTQNTSPGSPTGSGNSTGTGTGPGNSTTTTTANGGQQTPAGTGMTGTATGTTTGSASATTLHATLVSPPAIATAPLVTSTTPVKSPVLAKPTGTPLKTAPTTGSAAPAPKSGNYLVTITGLVCNTALTHSDAVYAAAFIGQYDRRTAQNTMITNAETWVYGDVNGMESQRKQAGSRSPTGGIGNGDFIPTGFMPGPKVTLPPQPNLFPMTVWQGTLTDGIDAVVISPSVWIDYGGDRSLLYSMLQNLQSMTNSTLLDSNVQNQINNQTLGPLFLGPSANAPGSYLQSVASSQAQLAVGTSITPIISGSLIPPFWLLMNFTGPNKDRPIGLKDGSSDPNAATIFPNATLVLTREIIESHLGNGNWTLLSFDFKDTAHSLTGNIIPGGDTKGEYTLFIQIQRQ